MGKFKTFLTAFMFLFTLNGCTCDDHVDRKCIQNPIASSRVRDDQIADFTTEIRMYGYSPEQTKKILTASELIRLVITSREFKDEVLGYTYKGKKQFFDTKYSNEEVYEKIVKGKEFLLTFGEDYKMTIDLALFTPTDDKDEDGLETVAYTYMARNMIWYNTKFLNPSEPPEVADTLMHEWTHKLGFEHSKEFTPDRSHSVPYAVGYMMERLARKYYLCSTQHYFMTVDLVPEKAKGAP